MTEHNNRILLQSKHTDPLLPGSPAVAGLLARQTKPVRRDHAFRKTEISSLNRYAVWQNPVNPKNNLEEDAKADEALTEAARMQEELAKEQEEFDAWRAQETERLERKHQKLRKQKRQMEQERKELDLEKLNFQRLQEMEETRNKKEEQLLEMKRQILEGELYKLAEEKRQFEQKKNFYDRVNSFQEETHVGTPLIQASVFFVGVDNAHTLKKRYKDLLKIYHPDNKCGDTDTIQQINREYQRLLEKLPG